MAQGARALRRAARHRRQVRGDARCARGGVPRGTLPAPHGPLLPQRAGKGARDQEEGRCAHAEGDPRAGIARGVLEEGGGGGGRAGRDEARRGREDGATTGSPRLSPTRTSRRSTGAESGLITVSSASTARSGGGRGS